MTLAGCTSMQPSTAPAPTARVGVANEAPRVEPGAASTTAAARIQIQEMEQVSTLINYAQNVAVLPADEQRKEYSGMNQSYAREPSPFGRVKLALLLCLPGASFQDDARALGLLEPLAAGGSAASGPLRRFAGLLHAQLNERVREQKRTALLREQLDALKAIERNLIERSQGGKPR